MTTAAIINVVLVMGTVTFAAGYFLWKVLTTPKHPGSHSYEEEEEK